MGVAGHPYRQIDAAILLIHGDADFAVPYQQIQVMAAKLKAAGVPVETLIIPCASHGWFGKTQVETIAVYRKALTATIDYFGKRFWPKP